MIGLRSMVLSDGPVGVRGQRWDERDPLGRPRPRRPHWPRRGHLGGSVIGAHYRHTTPEMAARAVDAIQQRLTVVLGVAELAVERHPNRSTFNVF